MAHNLKDIFHDDPEVLRALQDREQMGMMKELYKEQLMAKEKQDAEIINVKFLKGEKGDTGEQGIQGIQGEVGPQGESIKGDKGDSIVGPRGEKGETVVGARGPRGEKGEAIAGPKGEDATIDEKKLFMAFLKKLQKEQSLDISHIKNASSFMKDGIKYKIEELMHGGAGSSMTTSNVTTQYVLAAVQSGSDVTIALSQLTNFATLSSIITVYRNNVPQTQGASYNFTATATVVTIFNADAGEIFNITYSYT